MEAHEHVDEEEHINSPAHLEEVERVDESKEAAPQTAGESSLHRTTRLRRSEADPRLFGLQTNLSTIFSESRSLRPQSLNRLRQKVSAAR